MSANMNTTMNETQSPNCSIPGSSKAGKIGITFAHCLIIVVSLAGNSLLTVIVYKTKPMRKPINFFIVNMAMSDLLLAVFVLPSHLIELYGGFESFIGHLGLAFCKVRLFLIYVSCTISLESLVLIAVDRFVAVVFPLRAPFLRSKLCLFVILGTWLVTGALFSPVFFVKQLRCDWPWESKFFTYYFSTIPFVFCAISLALIIILYSIIVLKLKSHKIPGEQSISAEQKHVKMHRNVLKMVMAIVIGFLMCWGPTNVFWFLKVFVWDNTSRLSCDIILYRTIAGFLTYTNCALNPLICFTFSRNYRQGLKGLFGCQGTLQR